MRGWDVDCHAAGRHANRGQGQMSDSSDDVTIHVQVDDPTPETPPADHGGAADAAAYLAQEQELQRLRTENARLQGELEQAWRARAEQPVETPTADVEAVAAETAAVVAEAVAEAVVEEEAEAAAVDDAVEQAEEAAEEAEDAVDEITPEPARTHGWFRSLGDWRNR